MPKRISIPKRQAKKAGRKDSNQIAFATAQKTIEAGEMERERESLSLR